MPLATATVTPASSLPVWYAASSPSSYQALQVPMVTSRPILHRRLCADAVWVYLQVTLIRIFIATTA